MKNLNDFDELFVLDDEGKKRYLITKGDRKAIVLKITGFFFMLTCLWVTIYITSYDIGIAYSYVPASIAYIFTALSISNKRFIYQLEMLRAGCFREENNRKIPKEKRERAAYNQTKALFLEQ